MDNVEDVSYKRQKAIADLRKKLEGLTSINNLCTSDKYILRWLNSTDFDVETSFERIKDYHEFMIEYPDWFQRESPLTRKSHFDENIAMVLPFTDKEGRPIYIFRIGALNPDKAAFSEQACIDDIWYEYLLHKNLDISAKGVCMLLDFKGISWRYFKMLHYKDMKLGVRKLSSLPFKEFKLHIINTSGYTKIMVKIAMPFIPEASKKQIHFHYDMDTLYQYIDKDLLPPEYGGSNKINYKEIYESLYNEAEVITNNFLLHRSVTMNQSS